MQPITNFFPQFGLSDWVKLLISITVLVAAFQPTFLYSQAIDNDLSKLDNPIEFVDNSN
jgi:hypothetical protein